MNLTTALGIAVAATALTGSAWTVFSTVATKEEVQTSQQQLANAMTQMHKLDFIDNRMELIERELIYLEEKEELEGLTPSEQRRLDKLMQDLDYYEEQELEVRDSLLEEG
jgi:hypothetical protein